MSERQPMDAVLQEVLVQSGFQVEMQGYQGPGGEMRAHPQLVRRGLPGGCMIVVEGPRTDGLYNCAVYRPYAGGFVLLDRPKGSAGGHTAEEVLEFIVIYSSGEEEG
jgi:hypothetical protein